MSVELKARAGCCEEASGASRDHYIPCNRPAKVIVKTRDPEPYRMCEMCAEHNVANRGAEITGPYEGPRVPPAQDIDYSAYEADAATSIDAENILAQIARTVREAREARDRVKVKEEELKSAQQHLRTLEEYAIPELMREAGQVKLRTVDGYDVELTETLRASIPSANLHAAIAWLVEHNQGAIVKRDIRLQFGKGEDARADHALEIILEEGYTPEDKSSVHPQTLAAVIREMVAAGIDVPMELLGAHVQSAVKIKEVKK